MGDPKFEGESDSEKEKAERAERSNRFLGLFYSDPISDLDVMFGRGTYKRFGKQKISVGSVESQGKVTDLELGISGSLGESSAGAIGSGGVLELITTSEAEEGEESVVVERKLGRITGVDEDGYPIIERHDYQERLRRINSNFKAVKSGGRPPLDVDKEVPTMDQIKKMEEWDDEIGRSREKAMEDLDSTPRLLDRESDEYKEIYDLMNTALDIAEQENKPTDDERQKEE